MITGLEKIVQNKSNFPNSKHVNLIHHVNEESLKQVYKRLGKKKALGVDGVSKEAYGKELDKNISELLSKRKTFSYRPNASKRMYIPKVGSDKLRPLGIPSFEDKMVQGVMADVLMAIYEPLFNPFSYGFRPNKDCHQAIDKLDEMVFKNKVNYIVDADIKGFFNNVDHKIMINFLEEEIGDKSFLRYIARFLKAGTLEDGDASQRVTKAHRKAD